MYITYNIIENIVIKLDIKTMYISTSVRVMKMQIIVAHPSTHGIIIAKTTINLRRSDLNIPTIIYYPPFF